MRQRIRVHLNEDGAVGVGVGVDGARGALAAHVARERHEHAASRGLGEEGPGEGGDAAIGEIRFGGDRRALHPRSRGPPSPRRRAQHQPHRRILSPKP